jgi:hypothetical protein
MGVSVPLFAVFVWLDPSEDRFTLLRVIFVAVAASIAGVIAALTNWYLVWRRFIERERNGR